MWVDSENSGVRLSVSSNFDWENGGYQTDEDGNQYFCVKSGTRAYISHNLFGTNPKQDGAEFKIVFRSVNVRDKDAVFLTCIAADPLDKAGLRMMAHQAYVYTSSDTLMTPYSEEDVIEFEYNINSIDSNDPNTNYATDYAIGDTKLLDLGAKGQVYMELVALDTDDKADNSGKARMTWISKSIIETHRMNATNTTTDGWEATEMRTYLKETIKPLIPEVVRNAIVNVSKISATYENSAVVKDGQTTSDDVWIPSVHEIFNNTNYETTGAVYSTKFNSAANRIKYNASGSAYRWWLRSAIDAAGFRCVSNGGGEVSSGAYVAYGLVLGFCI